jgi:hypothetical protein
VLVSNGIITPTDELEKFIREDFELPKEDIERLDRTKKQEGSKQELIENK